jgi:hypothetical protein
MTDDKIEAWLKECELNLEAVPSFCKETKETLRKTYALVRVYREANQLTIETSPYVSHVKVARAAEEKAKEIVK